MFCGSFNILARTSNAVRRSQADRTEISDQRMSEAAVRLLLQKGVRGTTLAEQTDDALRIIEAVISVHGAHGAIVQQAVFLPNPALIDECREIIHKFYGKDLPATSYIAQPPCEGYPASRCSARSGSPRCLGSTGAAWT